MSTPSYSDTRPDEGEVCTVDTLPAVLAAKVEIVGTCWEWTGRIEGRGYGKVYASGKDHWAHRYSYECAKGPIPSGLHIDHLCRNRVCINPMHLEAVTPAENCRRSTSAEVTRARYRAQTHCKRGHPLSGDNVYVRKGSRNCKACEVIRGAASRAKNIDERRRRDRERYHAKAAIAQSGEPA